MKARPLCMCWLHRTNARTSAPTYASPCASEALGHRLRTRAVTRPALLMVIDRTRAASQRSLSLSLSLSRTLCAPCLIVNRLRCLYLYGYEWREQRGKSGRHRETRIVACSLVHAHTTALLSIDRGRGSACCGPLFSLSSIDQDHAHSWSSTHRSPSLSLHWIAIRATELRQLQSRVSSSRASESESEPIAVHSNHHQRVTSDEQRRASLGCASESECE